MLNSHSQNKGETHFPARLRCKDSTKGMGEGTLRPLHGKHASKVEMGYKSPVPQDVHGFSSILRLHQHLLPALSLICIV